MTDTAAPAFISDPDPDNPGWLLWRLSDERRFNGQMMFSKRLNGRVIRQHKLIKLNLGSEDANKNML